MPRIRFRPYYPVIVPVRSRHCEERTTKKSVERHCEDKYYLKEKVKAQCQFDNGQIKLPEK